jgi:hypothetical protein
MSDIRFDCPLCAGHLSIDDSGAGLEVSCPHCCKPILVPRLTSHPEVALPTQEREADPPPMIPESVGAPAQVVGSADIGSRTERANGLKNNPSADPETTLAPDVQCPKCGGSSVTSQPAVLLTLASNGIIFIFRALVAFGMMWLGFKAFSQLREMPSGIARSPIALEHRFRPASWRAKRFLPILGNPRPICFRSDFRIGATRYRESTAVVL